MTSGFVIIPEGEYVFRIYDATYDEDFGRIEIKLVNAQGATHTERFSIKDKNDEYNEKALNAFSYFAKTAMNDYTMEDIDPEQHHDFRRPRDGHPVWFVNPGVTSGEMMLTRQALLDFHNFLFRDGIVGQCYPSEAGTGGRRIVR